MVVAMLARARLGQGDVAAARALADEAIRRATAGHTQIWELHARHQRALAALAGDEPDGLSVAETELRRALALAVDTGAKAFEPRPRSTHTTPSRPPARVWAASISASARSSTPSIFQMSTSIPAF